MSNIIDARVIQKTGSEAEWLANDLILYKGEIALVSQGDRVINIKVGNGIKRFSELPYIYTGGFEDSVIPTTQGSTLVDGMYIANGAGTYTNMGGLEVREGYFTIISKVGTTYKIATEVKMPDVDLTPIENRITEVENNQIPQLWLNNTETQSEYINFTLHAGQILQNGNISPSNNWLYARVALNNLDIINITGLGNFNFSPKTPPYVRVAFYNSSNVMLSKIDWVEGVNSLEIAPQNNTSYILIQVDGGTGVGLNLESSIFLEQLKIYRVINIGGASSLKGEYVDFVNLITVDGSVSQSTENVKKTINEAISLAVSRKSKECTFLIKSGDYREIVNFGALKDGNFNFICKTPNTVRILGSDNISGFTLTSGKAKTYQVPFNKSIFKGLNSRFEEMIFEDGRPSMPINNSEVSPLQKSLSYRLPFTSLTKKTSINDVENTPCSFALISNVLYIHPSDSSDPNTNGFKYEVIQRDLNTIKSANNNELTNIYLENIQFFYGKTALRFIGFNSVTRLNITSLANLDAGAIRDDTCNVYAINDEAGFCDGDGVNGHYYANTSYNTLTNHRAMQPTAIYYNAWCHDCYDDGLSHHENHRVTLYGGLFEYNGDGGVRASNDANYDIYNATARGNGFRSDRSIGEGFGVVNPILNPNRNACKMNLYNCISYGNMVGYGAMGSGNILNIYNCTSRNNTNAELYADTNSKINSFNNKATNTNSFKIKVTASGGVINIINDNLIE